MKKISTVILCVLLIVSIIPMSNITANALLAEGYYTYVVINEKANIVDCIAIEIEDAVIPETLGGYPVTEIGSGIFSNNTKLTSVTIPETITSISDGAFLGCSNLKQVNICSLEAWCGISFGGPTANPLSYAGELFVNGEKLCGDLILPDGIRTIQRYTFAGYEHIESVTIANDTTRIGEGAFQSCNNLVEINSGNNIEYISDNAFSYCTNLKEVILPNSVTTIGEYAFAYCDSIEKIYIPETVKSIGYCAFDCCGSLESISVSENNSNYYSDTNCLIEKNSLQILRGCNNSIIPTSEDLPESSYYSIADYAFSGCNNLTDITIPYNINSFGVGVFYDCMNLQTVTFEEPRSIPEKTFWGCSNLKNVIGYVYNIGDRAFFECGNLENIYVKSGATEISDFAFPYLGNKTNVFLPYSIKRIGSKAFYSSSIHIWYSGSVMDRLNIDYEPPATIRCGIWHYNTCGLDKHIYSGDCDNSCGNCEWIRNVSTEHTYDNTCDTVCNTCGHVRTIEHTYASDCDRICNVCGDPREVDVEHAYDKISDTECNNCLERRTLLSVAITTKPSKLVYIEGTELDDSGMVLTLYYDNGTQGTITTGWICEYDFSALGPATVTVTYQNVSTTFTVTVNAKVLTSIAVTTKPAKVSYIEGTELDETGMVLTLYYNNDTSETVTAGWASEYDFSALGTCEVKVAYGGKTTSYSVTVIGKTLTSITVQTLPHKTVYWEGDSFDATGLTLVAHYDNGMQEIIVGNWLVTGYDSTPGTKTITVTYGDKTVTFTVEVTAKTLTSIEIAAMPNKLTYLEGDPFDTTGMVVRAYYNNNTSAIVTDYTVSGYDPTPGNKFITVAYGGKMIIFTVGVTTKSLASIDIITVPSKLTYLEGESFDKTGMVVIAYYNNNTNAVITDYTVSGYDPTPGHKIITVAYGGKTVTFTVEVTAKSLTSIEISTMPSKLTYLEGEPFDRTGMVVTAYYNNNTNAVITDYTVSGYNSEPGTKTITVSYGGKMATFSVVVKAIKNGWVAENGRWSYYENGVMLTNTWKKDSIGWVYLGSNGVILTDAWVRDSVGWCYVGADGYCVTNQWKRDSVGWCYLNANGNMTKSAWLKDGGKWYYLDTNGYMASNKWMKDSKGWVYLGGNGAMLTNAWVRDSVGWCYVGADGYAVTNCWKKDSVGWCYLNANGSMTKSAWVKDGGKWYYLNTNGYMVTGKQVIGGKTYTFDASGVWIA